MYESFSQDVKNEICSVRVKDRCCRGALLGGIIFGTNSQTDSEIHLESENPNVVMLYARLVKEFTGLKKESDISFTHIENEEKVRALINAIGMKNICISETAFFKCENCVNAFIKGVFLSCGTITYPGNSYHMEFLLRGEKKAEYLSKLLEKLGAPPKITERRGEFYGVYYKDSENVVDMLGHFGANKAAFKLLDVKIYKDLRNNANRIANCEAANIGKTVAASELQMRAIEKIINSGKADELPDELRATLDLRAAFPSATLNELALKHNPPITKSGVNHRLKRLVDFSEKL